MSIHLHAPSRCAIAQLQCSDRSCGAEDCPKCYPMHNVVCCNDAYDEHDDYSDLIVEFENSLFS